MSEFVVVGRHESAAVSLSYRFETGGWAIFTFNNATGELSVQSDWGDFSYRWHANPSSLGAPDLEHFLAKCGADYVADKFRIPSKEFDPDATLRAAKAAIIEDRRKQNSDKTEARFAFEDLAYLDFRDERAFIESVQRSATHSEIIEEPWELTKSRPTHQYEIFVKHLIPTFQADLRKRVEAHALKQVQP